MTTAALQQLIDGQRESYQSWELAEADRVAKSSEALFRRPAQSGAPAIDSSSHTFATSSTEEPAAVEETSPGRSIDASPHATAAPNTPTYTIVKEWPLGKIIVISPELRRDEAKLVELIRAIVSDPNVVNMRIYDDVKAATDTRNIFDLPTSEQNAIMKHFVGLYDRRIGDKTGHFEYYRCYHVLPNGDVDNCEKTIEIE